MAALSIGDLLGNQEGVPLLGLLREKKMHIWVLFLDPEDITILSLGAIWNFSKEQGSTELLSDYGTQRACL